MLESFWRLEHLWPIIFRRQSGDHGDDDVDYDDDDGVGENEDDQMVMLIRVMMIMIMMMMTMTMTMMMLMIMVMVVVMGVVMLMMQAARPVSSTTLLRFVGARNRLYSCEGRQLFGVIGLPPHE